MAETYSYLALGDSYTIGEMVPLHESFPYQLVQLLRKENYHFQAPEIIAKTGWTSDELLAATASGYIFQPGYDIVSLLIGVNNQYRGFDPGSYAISFEQLLRLAISMGNGNAKAVFILSIPDWGVTPFAEGRNRKEIASSIEIFNKINRDFSEKYGTNYIDITAASRKAASDGELLASDGLHPSGKAYREWAEEIIKEIKDKIK